MDVVDDEGRDDENQDGEDIRGQSKVNSNPLASTVTQNHFTILHPSQTSSPRRIHSTLHLSEDSTRSGQY